MRKKLNRVEEFKQKYSKEEFYNFYMSMSNSQMTEKFGLWTCHIHKLLADYNLEHKTKEQGYALRNKINTEKYGGNSCFSSPEYRLKREQTCLKKYGIKHPQQIPEIHQKAIETNKRNHNGIFSTADPAVKEKARKTCQEKYGTDSPNSAQEIKEKKKASNIAKYGVDNIFKDKEYIKNCCKDKFGEDNYFKTEEFKLKAKATCQEKYGVDFYTQTEYSKNNLRQKLPETLQKIRNTRDKKQNWNSSKAELYFKKQLIELFPEDDIITQYIDRRYVSKQGNPFKCDFYIKSLDLFIELNFYISHGPHPFNSSNEEDQKLLSLWKNKCGTYISKKGEEKLNSYYMYIKTWTEKDVHKLEIASTNHLNYIAVYTAIPKNQLKTLDKLMNILSTNPADLCRNKVIIWQLDM